MLKLTPQLRHLRNSFGVSLGSPQRLTLLPEALLYLALDQICEVSLCLRALNVQLSRRDEQICFGSQTDMDEEIAQLDPRARQPSEQQHAVSASKPSQDNYLESNLVPPICDANADERCVRLCSQTMHSGTRLFKDGIHPVICGRQGDLGLDILLWYGELGAYPAEACHTTRTQRQRRLMSDRDVWEVKRHNLRRAVESPPME